jgi:CDP-diacylglycerol---glycerol-3-phosphate 3-phosphatidyltransferase
MHSIYKQVRDIEQQRIYHIIQPLVKLLVTLKITPNIITTSGLIVNTAGAIVLIIGGEYGARGDLAYLGWGGGLFLLAGFFDMLDGQVARYGQMTSRFGALYDSVLDRYSELVMFLGICYFLVSHHYLLSSLLAFTALIGSLMVSYIRARAEGLGLECKTGLMQRPERIIIIGGSGVLCGLVSASTGGNQPLFSPWLSADLFETISIFIYPLTLVAILSNLTAITRLNYCWQQLRTEK